MRILHVLAQLPTRTGSGVYYSNVIKEFKKYEYEQFAIFAVQDGFEFDVLAQDAQFPVCFKSPQVPFPIAGMSDVMPYESTVYSHMNSDMLRLWKDAFLKALHKAKTKFNPDVVILHHLWILTSIAVEVFYGKILIGVCHNTDIRQAEQHPEMKSKYAPNIYKLDAIFSLSDLQNNKIADTFRVDQNKIITIGGGFNENLFYPAFPKVKKQLIQIVYSAKIERSKGVFELVRAFKCLSELIPDVHLSIIGIPNEENARALDALTENCRNISLVHIKDQKILADYIRDKDIFVMPSFFEGLGLMAIESLACGLLVVSTEIEALMNLLGSAVNNSGVIEYVKLPRIYDTDKPYEEDIDQFIDDLFAKLLKQVKRIENGENFPTEIRREINKHSWSGVAEKIKDEILKIVGTTL